jgi:hypothetical protein
VGGVFEVGSRKIGSCLITAPCGAGPLKRGGAFIFGGTCFAAAWRSGSSFGSSLKLGTLGRELARSECQSGKDGVRGTTLQDADELDDRAGLGKLRATSADISSSSSVLLADGKSASCESAVSSLSLSGGSMDVQCLTGNIAASPFAAAASGFFW